MRAILSRVFLVGCVAWSARADVQPAVDQDGSDGSAKVENRLVLLPAAWATQIPVTGRVNYPEFLTSLYPGQRAAVGLMATGADHETRLNDAVLRVRFAVGGKDVETRDGLKPVASRQIKAQGADFVLLALGAAGISEEERARVVAASSLQTLAVFATDWIVPLVGEPTDAEFAVEISGVAEPVAIKLAKLRIKTAADWLQESPRSSEEIGRRLNRYQGDLAPGELLSWLVSMAEGRRLREAPVHTFFALAFRSNPAAREAGVAAYPSLSRDVQSALLWILRLGGHDLRGLFPALPAQTLAALTGVEPLADPRKLPRFADPVDAQAVAQIGHAMDRCWAGWMVTGDKDYLRALVDLLGGAAEYPVFTRWQEAQAGAQGLNAQVARGLAYQIAGWSIGSFQRTDPLVADWLLFWQSDPSIPALVRQEIAALPDNPAFRRKRTSQGGSTR